MNHNAELLVVDDMEGMRRLLVNSLHQIGFGNVHTATQGSDAWRMLQERHFDMVLSDWNMPVMNGLDLLRKIRGDQRYANLPVIMLTAENDRRQVRVAIEAGVSEYLVKPFHQSALEEKMERAFAIPRPTGVSERNRIPVFARSAAERTASALITVQADAPSGQIEPSKSTILVVDDVPDNLTILVEMLGRSYQVKPANSGARALKIIESGRVPDLILLDVMMPEMDGFEVCRRLKENRACSDVPVIFLTAMNDVADVTRGFALGAVDYVSKPVEASILVARIETHLKLRRSLSELKKTRVELIEKNAVLQDNLRLRDDVERMAQHDLRGPIAGIIGFTGNLLSDTELAQQHKDVVHYIEQSAYGVLNMISLSLDLLRMEQGRYEFHPRALDIARVLQRLIREHAGEWTQRGLGIAVKWGGVTVPEVPECMVYGDELLCYSLFSNVMRNATEAAPTGSVMDLEIDVLGARLRIVLRNAGAVPPQIRERFFDKYTSFGKRSGSGIGTYSARLIATTLGGSIAMLASDEDNTTAITVEIPTPPDVATSEVHHAVE